MSVRMSGGDWLAIVVLLGVIVLAMVATARAEERGDKTGVYRAFITVAALLALAAGVIFTIVTLSLGDSVSAGRKLLFGGLAAVALAAGATLAVVALTGKTPRWVQRTLDWLADQPF